LGFIGDVIKIRETKKVTERQWERWLRIGSYIATIVSCIILIFIYFKIPNSSDLILMPQFGNEPGEISLHIHNRGGFIHNGTIYLTLLENGIYKVNELHGYTGTLSPGAAHTYEFRFNPLQIKHGTNYTVYIRVEADGRVSTSTIEGQWD